MTPRRHFALPAVLAIASATLMSWSVPGHPAGATGKHPALGGRAPRTIELSLRLSTDGSLRAWGVVWIDARANALSADLEVPMVTSDTAFRVRALKHRLYLTSPNLDTASGPVWYTRELQWPALERVVPYLMHPDPTLLRVLANATITHSASRTTYDFQETHFALGSLGSVGRATASAGHLRVRLRTGRHGEVRDVAVSFESTLGTTTASFSVLSYDSAVTVAGPPASEPTKSASPLLAQFLSTRILATLVLPEQWVRAISRTKLS